MGACFGTQYFLSNMKRKAEILAPAGSMESLIAGVRCGANAVYLGTKDINARRGAANFDFEQLREAVIYCHQRDVKVYLTLNIIVSDNEMKAAYNTVKKALECGVDAFIVQDLGVAKMMKEYFPQVRLHASTQCSVHSPEGFRALEKLGFERAVIPREMSLDEIKEIRQATSMELELFVHGALCMCVSGQCYLSAMLGGRSGNRGLCAQPCRLKFSADKSGSCDLSLKDLSLIEHMDEIEQAGISSLKIEGRMKRPEYVAAAVTACKNAQNNRYTSDEQSILKSVFSRSGFTDGYFTGTRSNMFGIRQKEDVVSAKDVLKDLSHLYDNENALLPIDLAFKCRKGEPTKLKATAKGRTVTATGEAPETAINKPLTVESVRSRLSKFGNTQYYLNKISIDLDDGLILSASSMNALRREVVEKLDEISTNAIDAEPFCSVPTREKDEIPYYTARFLNPETVPANHPFERIFIPIWSNNDDFIRLNAGVEIPRGMFSAESRMKARLNELKEIGVRTALCSNIGAYALAEASGFKAYGDFGLNIFNSETASLYKSPILSFETTLEQANSISAEDTGIVGYGKLPLMLTRNCPVKNNIGCEKCRKQGSLTDRKGYEFKVVCSPYPCVEILNPIPLYLGDRQDEVKVDFIHFYFTDESADEVKKVIDAFEKGREIDGKYTRGLYYRGVQ